MQGPGNQEAQWACWRRRIATGAAPPASRSTRIRAVRRILPGSYIAASKGPPMATAEPGNNSDPYLALVGHRPNSADTLRRFT